MSHWRRSAAAGLAMLATFIGASLGLAQTTTQTPAWTLAHDYAFRTLATRPDGKPLCEEHWTFEPDGTATASSGEEVVRFHYVLEGNWLSENMRETNGAPDCMGTSRPKGPEPDLGRLYLVPVKSGGFLVCRADPGRRISSANCPARADPAP